MHETHHHNHSLIHGPGHHQGISHRAGHEIGDVVGREVGDEDISWDWKILLPKVLISMGYIRFTTKVRNMPLKE